MLENRTAPSFEVRHIDNGKTGLEWIREGKYDIVILDVKMPAMDGRDVYRQIKLQQFPIPVIIFFDAISGEEIIDIHKIGRPAIVEKGSHQSSMPEMPALVAKMVYFS